MCSKYSAFYCRVWEYICRLSYEVKISRSAHQILSLSEAAVPRSSVKGVLGNFAKFIGKQLLPQACNIIKKRDSDTCVFQNFAKFSRTLFLTEHIWWLLLHCELMKNLFHVDFIKQVHQYIF